MPFSWLAEIHLPQHFTYQVSTIIYYIGLINASAHPLSCPTERQLLARQPLAREMGQNDIPALGSSGLVLLEEHDCVVSECISPVPGAP